MIGLCRAWCRGAAAATSQPLRSCSGRALSTTTAATSSSSSGDGNRPSVADLTPKYRYFIPEELLADASEAVRRSLSLENADASERKQAEKVGFIRKLGQRDGDTGSTPVQIACLTVRIKGAQAHCAVNKQDKVSKRALVALVTRRRRLLKYLRRKDFRAYHDILKELNLEGFS